MTDKELLELAAKAIGMTLQYNYLGGRDASQPWNPLTDDGDALQLVVDLGMVIDVRYKNGGMRAHNEITYWIGDDVTGRSIIFGFHTKDESRSACRRAIVCAAAEIGKAMP